MASNSFGELFKITTFGESHGECIGVVIDGCPPGFLICEEDIQRKLDLRRPGGNTYISQRNEQDLCQIVSGIFDGKTTGMPITILIKNQNAQSENYYPIKDIYRPGHANFTYLHKYGAFDYRGGGRASARETACRVAAGAVAEKMLDKFQIKVIAYLRSVGSLSVNIEGISKHELTRNKIYSSPVYCPCENVSKAMTALLDDIKEAGDSIGGVVEFIVNNMPIGLGEPVYQKLEAKLAFAMMSIPGSRGFEMGDGFKAVQLKGSESNDQFIKKQNGGITFSTNHSGGVLAGISSGMPLVGRVAFKATPSIFLEQKSYNIHNGEDQVLKLSPSSKHDPCIAIRAVPVVEAMCSLVLSDALMLNAAFRVDR